jgi:hypothetical protein
MFGARAVAQPRIQQPVDFCFAGIRMLTPQGLPLQGDARCPEISRRVTDVGGEFISGGRYLNLIPERSEAAGFVWICTGATPISIRRVGSITCAGVSGTSSKPKAAIVASSRSALAMVG